MNTRREWLGISNRECLIKSDTPHAELDEREYPTGVKIPDQQMRDLDDTGVLARHDWHGEWNYTLNPTRQT